MVASDGDRAPELRRALLGGAVIPAHPLALTEARRLDERRQIALTRYYCDAGAGGIAVGVHTTQFAIRDPSVQLLPPILDLAARTVRDWCSARRPIMIAGVCGLTPQAVREAELAASLDYDAALLSLAALRDQENECVLDHCRRVAEIIPVMGFYLQPAVGGRILDRAFWRRFLDIERVVAIKVAPFDRYRTLDVVAALAESGRDDVALYTGNDDSIVADLLTPFPGSNGSRVHFSGGLLGQWAVWTKRAVELLRRCRAITSPAQRSATRSVPGSDPKSVPGSVPKSVPGSDPKSDLGQTESRAAFREISTLAESCDEELVRLLALGAELTDANAAIFDPVHRFAGCIPGIHEVLRRQGLLAGRWCLDPHEDLSPGQIEEIDRVLARYPHLSDDIFVREHLDEWLG